jgi:bacteriocin biosynthesis cyclodehydratase domain-containing protein
MDEDLYRDVLERVEYPRLNPYFIPVVLGSNTVQFRVGPWGGPTYNITDEDEENKLPAVIEALDSRTRLDELIEEFDPEDAEAVLSLLRELHERGVVVDGDGEGASEPWSALRLGGSVEFDWAVDIVVVGSGPVWEFVSEDVARLDVESAVRHESDLPLIGRDEGQSAAGDPSPERGGALRDADFVVYAANEPRSDLLAAVNEVAVEHGIPLITGQVHGLDGIVGPTVFPGDTACYHCFAERMRSNVNDREGFLGYEAAPKPDRRDNVMTTAVSRVVAGYLIADLVTVLTSGRGFTAGSVVHLDFFGFAAESNRVLKLPRCPVCGVDRRSEGTRQVVSIREILNAEGTHGTPTR